MKPRWTGPLACVLTLAGLAAGWWWVAAPAGLVAGWVARPGGRPFLDGFLGGLLGWALADAWRILFWNGYQVAWLTSALAGLPAAAAPVFFVLPGLVAALAAGFAALAGAHARSALGRVPATRRAPGDGPGTPSATGDAGPAAGVSGE